MKIAIIGSGISGLTAAYALHRRHEITVFEAGSWIGGHTHTVPVKAGGTTWNIDTGFIVFNETHYPLFSRLLRDLGVASRTTSMSFGVRHDPSGIEYSTASANTLFAQRRNVLRPGFHRMWTDILRFNREAPLLEGVRGDATTVRDYVEGHGYSRQFLERYLVPLGAALWSCPPGTFREFPIRFVVDFLSNHNMLQLRGQPVWRVVTGGSARYVEALTAGFRDRILINTPITSLTRTAGGIRIRDAAGQEGRFDHAVVACHADQALRMLGDPHPLELDLLGAFPYQPNDAILHTDTSALPRNRRVWSAWNYHVPAHDPSAVKVTYNMSILQGLQAPETFCVTLNDTENIDPARILGRYRYEHPVFTSRRATAQARHHELVGFQRTSYCGAYWGFGFHEDGVRSGLVVSQHLKAKAAA